MTSVVLPEAILTEILAERLAVGSISISTACFSFSNSQLLNFVHRCFLHFVLHSLYRYDVRLLI